VFLFFESFFIFLSLYHHPSIVSCASFQQEKGNRFTEICVFSCRAKKKQDRKRREGCLSLKGASRFQAPRRDLLRARDPRLDRGGQEPVDPERLRDGHGQARSCRGLRCQSRDVLSDVPPPGEEVGGEHDSGGAEGGSFGDGVVDRRTGVSFFFIRFFGFSFLLSFS